MPRRLSFALLAAAAPCQSVDELVARLARAPAVEAELVGDAPSAVFADYRRLAASASPARLVELAAHESAVVRCYAVRGLAELGAVAELPAILRTHAADTVEVEVRSGCERYTTYAGDVMFDDARPKLSGEQVLDLAEFLLRAHSPLYARQWALRNVRFRDGMLRAVRELAQAGDPPALIALMRFKVASDAEILLAALRRLGDGDPFDDNCAFLAAEISRDRRLLPALAELLPAARRRLQRDDANRLRFWLLAITAQGSAEAAQALAGFVAGDPAGGGPKRAELRKVVLEAIEQHPAAAFEELRAALRERDR